MSILFSCASALNWGFLVARSHCHWRHVMPPYPTHRLRIGFYHRLFPCGGGAARLKRSRVSPPTGDAAKGLEIMRRHIGELRAPITASLITAAVTVTTEASEHLITRAPVPPFASLFSPQYFFHTVPHPHAMMNNDLTSVSPVLVHCRFFHIYLRHYYRAGSIPSVRPAGARKDRVRLHHLVS